MRTLIELAMDLSREMHTIKIIVRLEEKKFKQQFLNDWKENTQVPSLLNISRRKLQYLRKSGELPFSNWHGKIYYKVHDLYHLIESNYRSRNRKSIH